MLNYMKHKYLIYLLILSLIPLILTFFLLKSINSKTFDRYYSAVVHYKIARDIKNKYIDTIDGLNTWMSLNYITSGMDENYLPILDKNSLYRLIDGYSVCDGSAHTYTQIAIFLDIKGYTIPLYNKEYSSSPHTITLLTPNNYEEQPIDKLISNSVVIDPVLNIIFKNEDNYASLKNICRNEFNKKQKNYFDKYYTNSSVFLNYYCYTKDKWMRNSPKNNLGIPLKSIIFILDLLPDKILLLLHKIFINLYFESNYLKARNFDIFGNFADAKKYYNKVILENSKKNYNIFRGAAKNEIYNIKIDTIKPIKEKDLSNFYLNILNYKENNIINKNPFTINQKPFFKLYENYFYKIKL